MKRLDNRRTKSHPTKPTDSNFAKFDIYTEFN